MFVVCDVLSRFKMFVMCYGVPKQKRNEEQNKIFCQKRNEEQNKMFCQNETKNQTTTYGDVALETVSAVLHKSAPDKKNNAACKIVHFI